MTGYCDEVQATTHQSRHYESCLNSTCSRSPSPIRRQLWEPQHPPSLKLKNNQKLPLKPFDTSKQSTNHTQKRDKSPFLPPPRDLNGASTPNRCRDPLFTYTINEGPLDSEYHTKNLEIKIQKRCDSSRPSSGSKTPEPCLSNPPLKDQVAAGNLKLELELDTSRVPPIVTFKNNNTIISAQQPVQVVSSTPVTTCNKSYPCSSSCCTQPHPCSPRQNTESCDLLCQPCSCRCPYLSSPRSNLKEDRATSPTQPFSTPPELEPCSSICQVCPISCPYASSSATKEDKAISPINPRSRSASPGAQRNSSPNSIHGHTRNGSDKSSEGTIEVKFDDGSEVHVDWEGNVGPIKVDFPITPIRDQTRRSDDVHSYDPQLEAFYTSSYNHSGSPSPCKSRSVSPSSPPAERQGPKSIVPCPPCYLCGLNNYDSSNEAQLASICPSRSPCSPSTSYSRSPQSKSLSKKALSRNNSFGGIEIHSEGGEIITNIDWSSPISNVDTLNPFSKPERFDCRTEEQSLSPMLTLTPTAEANGHVTFEWSPRSAHEKRCKETGPLVLNCRTPREGYEDFRTPYYHDEVGMEEWESSPKVIPQILQHPTSQNSNSEYKTCMQSKDFPCTPSCTLPCTLNCCTPPCDPCQGSSVGCDGCCCCNKDCMAPTDGINGCTSLPPHLQSDWSANLRSPPSELRTKPILYRDTQGHEHIMFADGSIEHLSRHCEPMASTPPQPVQRQPSPPLSPPSYFQNLFHREGKFDRYVNNFSPHSGDIVIRAHQRLPCMYPAKDNGQVAFFTSDYLDLQEGDSIVRLGKFDESAQWCSSDVVEMYLRGSHGQWKFLGTTDGHSILYPLEADQHQVVKTPNKQLKLRQGDLVISTFPSPNSFYFWNPKRKVEVDHSHLLLRAYIGHPQVVDENHNLACCVAGHLPVGYAELYVKVKRIWLFLGRDDHMFSEHELMHFS